ncbi:hypothetical protein B0H17DRAFT_1151421 [Mycena rosella]|uniref:Uncharacterized protein n=1 Tax=Mycena rosella TaxID=1033263 RepID=A0AAD7FHC0_MYCRO|nr:hypothetical protein B0H17DRAFT_1151421 [Mycena rosella]
MGFNRENQAKVSVRSEESDMFKVHPSRTSTGCFEIICNAMRMEESQQNTMIHAKSVSVDGVYGLRIAGECKHQRGHYGVSARLQLHLEQCLGSSTYYLNSYFHPRILCKARSDKVGSFQLLLGTTNETRLTLRIVHVDRECLEEGSCKVTQESGQVGPKINNGFRCRAAPDGWSPSANIPMHWDYDDRDQSDSELQLEPSLNGPKIQAEYARCRTPMPGSGETSVTRLNGLGEHRDITPEYGAFSPT